MKSVLLAVPSLVYIILFLTSPSRGKASLSITRRGSIAGWTAHGKRWGAKKDGHCSPSIFVKEPAADYIWLAIGRVSLLLRSARKRFSAYMACRMKGHSTANTIISREAFWDMKEPRGPFWWTPRMVLLLGGHGKIVFFIFRRLENKADYLDCNSPDSNDRGRMSGGLQTVIMSSLLYYNVTVVGYNKQCNIL